MRFNKLLEGIKNYEAGKPIELVVREFGIDEKDIVKLASNENPLGTSPKAKEALINNASNAYRYPDDSMYALKASLAARFGIEHNEIIIGAGSDQVLEFASRIMLDSSSCVLMSRVTFAMYAIYAKQMGAKVVRTPSFEHKAKEFIALYNEHKPRIVYICTPNNPTGDATPKEEIGRIIEAVDSNHTLVVIDGAYMEYAKAKDETVAVEPKEILAYSNVLYLGTFSKAYGLGGMRVGYGIANKKIIAALYKMRPPFNITTLSLQAAVAANSDEAFIQQSIALNSKEMKRYEAFALSHAIDYIDSYTNFITYLFDDAQYCSSDISNRLLQRGIIVRDLASYNLNALRITVGTKEQNHKLLQELSTLL